MPGSHRNAKIVEDLADVVRVDPVHLERHGAAAVLGRGGPEDPHALDVKKRVESVRG